MTKFMLKISNDKIDSRDIAEMVGKNHKDLLRDIRLYIDVLVKSGERKFAPSYFFQESTYFSDQGKKLPCFEVTKKGCDMIANKMTGEKGIMFTAAYIDAFYKMENTLLNNKISLLDESFNKRIALLEKNVNDRMRISRAQERTLQRLIGSAVHRAYEKDMFKMTDELTSKRRIYPKIHKDIRNRYSIPSYGDLREKDFEDCVNYINNWIETKY